VAPRADDKGLQSKQEGEYEDFKSAAQHPVNRDPSTASSPFGAGCRKDRTHPSEPQEEWRCETTEEGGNSKTTARASAWMRPCIEGMCLDHQKDGSAAHPVDVIVPT
jgi:hypothetical protein